MRHGRPALLDGRIATFGKRIPNALPRKIVLRAHHRAVSTTTAPTFITVAITAGLLFLMTGALGCGRPSIRHEHELAPGRGHHPGLTRAFLVPVNQTEKVPPGLDIGDDILNDLIVRYLESKGLRVESMSPVAYRRAAKDAIRTAQNEALHGTSDEASGTIVFSSIVPHLLEDVDSDAQLLIVPNVKIRAGEYTGKRMIRWDGVKRKEKIGLDWRIIDGNPPVASLHMLIFEPSGEQIFAAYGGLDAIFEMNIREKKYDLKEDLFQNEEFLAEGICISFHPFFGPAEEC